MKNIITYLEERSFIEQKTSDNLKALAQKPLKVYIGFDPTSDSLHLGNLVGIMALKHFQRLGHQPYIIIGGATARIGDPSGKSEERPLLKEEELKHNIQSITTLFKTLFQDADESTKPVILNNEQWLASFSFIDFLRDVGKQFRLGPMLAKDSVKTRLHSDEGMSFTEFSYQVLQGFDFYHLFKEKQVILQLGGGDQWGNITAGMELIRKLTGKSAYGLTFPLLTRSDGKKFGKTEEGAIWLSKEKLSPYQFYQYLVRIADADVISLLRMLTFLEMSEIRQIEKDMKKPDYEPNAAQKKLASEVTRFVHGEEGLEIALKVTKGARPGAKTVLKGSVLEEISKDMPNIEMGKEQVLGKKFTEVASKIGLVSSKSEALRLIKNGGAYVNNDKIEDPFLAFSKEHIIDKIYLLLGAGKKKKILIRLKTVE